MLSTREIHHLMQLSERERAPSSSSAATPGSSNPSRPAPGCASSATSSGSSRIAMIRRQKADIEDVLRHQRNLSPDDARAEAETMSAAEHNEIVAEFEASPPGRRPPVHPVADRRIRRLPGRQHQGRDRRIPRPRPLPPVPQHRRHDRETRGTTWPAIRTKTRARPLPSWPGPHAERRALVPRTAAPRTRRRAPQRPRRSGSATGRTGRHHAPLEIAVGDRLRIGATHWQKAAVHTAPSSSSTDLQLTRDSTPGRPTRAHPRPHRRRPLGVLRPRRDPRLPRQRPPRPRLRPDHHIRPGTHRRRGLPAGRLTVRPPDHLPRRDPPPRKPQHLRRPTGRPPSRSGSAASTTTRSSRSSPTTRSFEHPRKIVGRGHRPSRPRTTTASGRPARLGRRMPPPPPDTPAQRPADRSTRPATTGNTHSSSSTAIPSPPLASGRRRVLQSYAEFRARAAAGENIADEPAFLDTLDRHAALVTAAEPFRTHQRKFANLLKRRGGLTNDDLEDFRHHLKRARDYRRGRVLSKTIAARGPHPARRRGSTPPRVDRHRPLPDHVAGRDRTRHRGPRPRRPPPSGAHLTPISPAADVAPDAGDALADPMPLDPARHAPTPAPTPDAGERGLVRRGPRALRAIDRGGRRRPPIPMPTSPKTRVGPNTPRPWTLRRTRRSTRPPTSPHPDPKTTPAPHRTRRPREPPRPNTGASAPCNRRQPSFTNCSSRVSATTAGVSRTPTSAPGNPEIIPIAHAPRSRGPAAPGSFRLPTRCYPGDTRRPHALPRRRRPPHGPRRGPQRRRRPLQVDVRRNPPHGSPPDRPPGLFRLVRKCRKDPKKTMSAPSPATRAG